VFNHHLSRPFFVLLFYISFHLARPSVPLFFCHSRNLEKLENEKFTIATEFLFIMARPAGEVDSG
jgi:hypothetical protein